MLQSIAYCLPCELMPYTSYDRASLLTQLFLPQRSDLTLEQRRLAEITEMIHTASLVHDDVLDECSVRRGAAGGGSKPDRLQVQGLQMVVFRSKLRYCV